MATQIFCIFTPIHGETIPIFDEHMFQMNWFNHQLAYILPFVDNSLHQPFSLATCKHKAYHPKCMVGSELRAEEIKRLSKDRERFVFLCLGNPASFVGLGEGSWGLGKSACSEIS